MFRRSLPCQEWVEELEKDANVGHACLLACHVRHLPFMLREQPSVAGITGTIIPPLLLLCCCHQVWDQNAFNGLFTRGAKPSEGRQRLFE